MELFESHRHEPLKTIPWDPDRLEDYAHDILCKTISSFHPDSLWPVHPLDGAGSSIGFKDFYFGAGGNFWLLNRYSPQSKRDFRPEFLSFLGLETFPEPGNVSLFFDEIGFLLFKEKVSPSQNNRDLLYKKLTTTSLVQLNEILYGIPSTLLVTLRAHDLTRESRFYEKARQFKEFLWKNWEYDQSKDCYLWTQHFEVPSKYIGAAHGAYGNLQVLFLMKPYLSSEEFQLLNERARASFLNLASVTDVHANWTVKADAPAKFLLQWCHGAPGVICALADHLPQDPQVNEVLLKGGELIWHAGPLKKGTSLCHGTSGNALAFLKLFARTGDTKWLSRAQAFAMHCLEQCQDQEKEYGHLRYSLWTGDLGLVWLNEQLKDQTAHLPYLDLY